MPEPTTGTAGEGGQTTTGTTGTQGTSSTAAPTTGTPNTTGTQAAPTTGSTGATTGAQPTGFSYKEDRSTWVPAHRIRETTEAKDKLASELELTKKQLAALTGVSPASPDAAKEAEIKEAFFKLMPGARKLLGLSEEQIDRLLKTPDTADSAREFVSQGWQKHGKAMMGKLVTEVSDAIGGDMSERAQGRLKAAFVQMLDSERNKSVRENDGKPTELLQKYLDGDESLIQDFAKEWAEDYFVPARRQIVSREVSRIGRQVPNPQGRSQQTSTQRPAEFKTDDERLDYAAKVMRESGHQFARE